MKTYKALDNSLHALSDNDVAVGGRKLIPPGSIQITDEEVDLIRTAEIAAQPPTLAPGPTLEDILVAIELAGGPLKAALADRMIMKNNKPLL